MSKNQCVFLIDDDPSARNGISRLLRAGGHVVRVFESGDAFLDGLDPDAAGCILLDARMPGISFSDLHAEIQSRGLALPMIFVTADDDPETRSKALALGASGFFRKPVDGTALLDAIEWALSKVGRK